jgi:hypothetical protein
MPPEMKEPSALERHETELKRVRDRVHDLIERVSKETLALEKELSEIKIEVARLDGQVPDGLAGRLQNVENVVENLIPDELPVQLANLTKDVQAVQREIISREEWGVLKTEHDQIKRLTYGFVGLVLLEVITAIIALVVMRS